MFEDKPAWSIFLAIANCRKTNNHTPVTRLLSADQSDACGEDSFCIHETLHNHILSIADGVGGWRSRGVDPAVFAQSLMDQVGQINEKALSSKRLIQEAFSRLLETYEKGEDEPFGASTICVAVLDKYSGVLDLASLGDSQAIVIREGKIILKTERQQSRFNAPLQLALKPTGKQSGNPQKAYHTYIQTISGDLIILATDGLWDNLFLDQIEGICEQNRIDEKWLEGQLALELVEAGRTVSINENARTPFEVYSEMAGREHRGGKKDDITLIVASIH